jgi:hypothetical protein
MKPATIWYGGQAALLRLIVDKQRVVQKYQQQAHHNQGRTKLVRKIFLVKKFTIFVDRLLDNQVFLCGIAGKTSN